MSTNASVDVFLGHPLVDTNEKLFLARLRRDLVAAGVNARILANAQVGKDFLELDFVVVTDTHTAVIELKAWRDPVVARPNGRWQRIVEGHRVDADGNPYRQAAGYGFALSDEMRDYAHAAGAPGPTKDKFVKDLDLLVCMYPEVRAGSTVQNPQHVRLLGYGDLLDRLIRPGRVPAWSAEDWDGFIRHLGLYRDEEDSDTAVAHRQSTAIADEYAARFAAAHLDVPPVVATSVRHDGADTARPDLAGALLTGRDVVLWGPSGQGKSLWATEAAYELARQGHLPVWLPARSFEADFATFLARSVAPYSTCSAAQLVASARAAGRHVVFIVDGLNERPEEVQSQLLTAVRALRLNSPSHTVLLTAQQPAAPGFAGAEMIELQPLSEAERQQVLDAYTSDVGLEALVGVTTPLDLSIAASCAPGVTATDGPAAFIDAYVDAQAGSPTTRAVLVRLAWRMHEQLRLSLRAADASRGVRRELGLDAGAVADALSCRLVRHEQGRVAFRHERFATFLAAEALLEHAADGRAAGALLNQPRAAALSRDAVGLESDAVRLRAMLETIRDVEVLVEAADGQLGEAAAQAARDLLAGTVRRATSLMAEGGVTFAPSAQWPTLDAWNLGAPLDDAERTRLVAAGRCLGLGLLTDDVARLLVRTEDARALAGAGIPQGNERTFQAAYACGRSVADLQLPAALVAQGVTDVQLITWGDPRTRLAAHALMASEAAGGDGAVFLALRLLRLPEPEDADLLADLIERALPVGPYHLQLAAFEVVERAGRWLPDAAHARVLEAVENAAPNNIFLQSSQVEALSALGAIEPINALDDLRQQLQITLSKPDDRDHCKLAYGAISSQFEEEDIVGPWSQAIGLLDDHERALLFAMALRSQDDGFGIATSWILAQDLDLSEPRMRAAVLEFVGRLNPASSPSSQHTFANAVTAVQHLARADLSLPASSASEHREAWETFLALVAALTAGDNTATLARATDLVEEHRAVIADLLVGLHWALVIMPNRAEQLEREIIAALGAPLVDVLIDGLQHPETVASVARHRDSAAHSITLLGRVGDARVADVLRAFADHPSLGSTAVAAVREIEARG